MTVRNLAMLVLECLFKRLCCGTPHQVLIELIEDPDVDATSPTLQFMLSPCPELKSWYRVRCDWLDWYVFPLGSSKSCAPCPWLSRLQVRGCGGKCLGHLLLPATEREPRKDVDTAR